MASSSAATVTAYLAELSPERRAVIAGVRRIVKRHLPSGYMEVMRWGMIAYEIPLTRYPDTYNGQPLCYAALAAQKSHSALYLTCSSQDPALARKLKQGFKAAGKKLNMGKSCLRFQRLEDLPLELLGEIIASTPVDRFITLAESARRHL